MMTEPDNEDGLSLKCGCQKRGCALLHLPLQAYDTGQFCSAGTKEVSTTRVILVIGDLFAT